MAKKKSESDKAESSDPKGQQSSRPKTIDEALRVLDEALAGPATELKSFVNHEIESFNSTIQSTLGSLRAASGPSNLQETAAKVTDAVSEMTETLKTAAGKSFESVRSEATKAMADSAATVVQMAEDVAAEGVELAREAYQKADAEVRANPWPYIGGVAVGTFALGAIWGHLSSRARD